MRIRLTFLRLRRDQRGVSVIEFGFLAPVLALFAMGIMDLSRALSERFTLQQAVNQGLELVQARPGRADADESDVDYSYVATEVADVADVEEDEVTITRWRECNGIPATEYEESCAEGEDQARYLRVRVEKEFDGQFYFNTIDMAASGALRIQ